MFMHLLAVTLKRSREYLDISPVPISEVTPSKPLPFEMAAWAAQHYPSFRGILETRMGRRPCEMEAYRAESLENR